jgi:hypothetical protein
VAFVSTVSRTAEANAPGIQHLANRLTGVDTATRDEFARISSTIGAKNAEREAAAGQFRTNVTNVRAQGKKLRR